MVAAFATCLNSLAFSCVEAIAINPPLRILLTYLQCDELEIRTDVHNFQLFICATNQAPSKKSAFSIKPINIQPEFSPNSRE